MRPGAVSAALAILVLAGCGSGSRSGVTSPRTGIQPATAASIAHRSDVLAAALRRGDACAAKTQAHGLERMTSLAIAHGRIPQAYRPRLLAAIQQLVAQLPVCTPPAPPPPPPAAPPAPPPKHEHHPPKPKPPKHHDHGGHGHGGGDQGDQG